jgi:hypothetical protein
MNSKESQARDIAPASTANDGETLSGKTPQENSGKPRSKRIVKPIWGGDGAPDDIWPKYAPETD